MATTAWSLIPVSVCAGVGVEPTDLSLTLKVYCWPSNKQHSHIASETLTPTEQRVQLSTRTRIATNIVANHEGPTF